MRILALGLMGLLVLSRLPVATPADPTAALLAQGDAIVKVADKSGQVTTIAVHLVQFPGGALLALTIDRSPPACRPTPGCGSTGVYRVTTPSNPIDPAGALIDRNLGWASLSATVPVADQWTGVSEAVQVDVQWTANGSYTSLPPGMGWVAERPALVTGLVSSPALGVVRFRDVAGGTLARHHLD